MSSRNFEKKEKTQVKPFGSTYVHSGADEGDKSEPFYQLKVSKNRCIYYGINSRFILN